MHFWGDGDFDWVGLDDSISMIAKNLKRARVNVRDYKEKYGTCRIYCSLGWYSLHDITHPGYVCYRYPKWLVHLDIYYLSKIVKLLNWIVVPIHKWVYKNAYKKAVKKYPHLIEEICCCADYVDLLDFYESPWRKV